MDKKYGMSFLISKNCNYCQIAILRHVIIVKLKLCHWLIYYSSTSHCVLILTLCIFRLKKIKGKMYSWHFSKPYWYFVRWLTERICEKRKMSICYIDQLLNVIESCVLTRISSASNNPTNWIHKKHLTQWPDKTCFDVLDFCLRMRRRRAFSWKSRRHYSTLKVQNMPQQPTA